MTFSLFGWLSKNKSVEHATPIEMAFIEGYSKGFENGLASATELDTKTKEFIRNKAISESLERLNGNKTTD